jgi:hypothetical protein
MEIDTWKFKKKTKTEEEVVFRSSSILLRPWSFLKHHIHMHEDLSPSYGS